MNIKNTLLFGIMSFMMLISIPNHVNAELKMGIVNLDLLFKEIPIYRESQAKIKKQFDPRARNLKTLEKEWTTLNEKYLKNEKVMSESEKTSLVEKIKGSEPKKAINTQLNVVTRNACFKEIPKLSDLFAKIRIIPKKRLINDAKVKDCHWLSP